jgi:hypothetical protein
MNPQDDLIKRLIAEGKSDDEIHAALDEIEARQPSARPAPVRSALTGRTTEESSGVAGGSAWAQAQAGPVTVRPRNPHERVGTAVKRAAVTMGQGASLGFADDVLGTAYGVATGRGGQAGRDAYRAQIDDARQAAPKVALAAEIAGGFAVPVGRVARGVVGAKGAKIGKQMWEGVKAAAPVGGLAGIGNADGGVGERLKGGVIGAAAGGVLGAAVPAVFASARQGAKYLGFKNDMVTKERIAEALQEVAEREKNPGIVAVRPGARGRTMMDQSPSTRELALDAARASPKAERELEQLARTRAGGQNTAIAREAAEALDVPLIEADRAKASIAKLVKSKEDKFYPALWKAFPEAIDDPKMLELWGKGREHLGKRIRDIEVGADLSGQNIDELFGTGGAPTLRGLHEFRTRAREISDGLLKGGKKQLKPSQQSLLRNMREFLKQIDQSLADVPGGKEYRQIRKIGRDARVTSGALDEGGKSLAAKVSPEQFASALSKTDKPKAFRQGMASDFLRRSGSKGEASAELLNRASSQDVQRKVSIAAKPKNTFTRNIGDIKEMSLTNADQLGRKTPTREILKGSRRAATALAFGEASLVGALAGGAPVAGPARLATGALIAKALEGRRGKATEKAAEEITKMLMASADDPQAAQRLRNAADQLRRLSRQRIGRQNRYATRLTVGANTRQPDNE